MPILALIVIFAGFDGMTVHGNWTGFFLVLGGLTSAGKRARPVHLPRQSGPASRAGRHVPARRALRFPPGEHPRQQDDLHLLSRHDVLRPCHAAVAAVHDLTRRGHARHRQLHPAHRHRRACLGRAVRARGQGHGPLRQGEVLLPRGDFAGARRADRLFDQVRRPRHAAAVRRRHVHHG